MPRKFACPACGGDLVVFMLDKGKEAECPGCKLWSLIPEATSETGERPNCKVRLKNSILDLPAKTKPGILPESENKSSDSGEATSAGYRQLAPFPEKEEVDPEAFRDLLLSSTPNARVTQVLLLVNALVFILMVSSGVNFFFAHSSELIRFGGKYNYRILAQNDWWRLVSAFFIHGGIIHAGLNMVFLWLLGNLGERIFGSVSFFMLYIACGFAGSIASFIASPNIVSACATAPVLGISGGLVAFLVAGNASVPKIYVRKIIQDLAIFGCSSMALGFIFQGIDNVAGLSGLAAGFFCGLVLKRKLPEDGNASFMPSHAAFIGGFALAVFLGVSGGISLYKDSKGNVTPDAPRVMELLEENRVPEAIALIDKKPELLSYVPYREFIEGLRYVQRGDKENAYKSFSESIRKDPSNIPLRLHIAVIYTEIKSYGKAMETYGEIIRLAPKEASAYGNLGWVYYLEGDFNECIRMSEKANELDKSLYYVKYNIALSRLRLGETREAVEIYKSINPSNSAEAKSAREGAIEDLRDLLRQDIKTDEARAILKEIFGISDYKSSDQSDVSA